MEPSISDVAHKLEGHDAPITAIGMNSLYVATCSTDSTAKVWNLLDGSLVRVLSEPTACRALAISETYLAIASRDKLVRVYRLQSGRIIYTLRGHSNGIRALGMRVGHLVSASKDKTAKVWSLVDGNMLHTLRHPKAVGCAAINSSVVASIAEDRAVRLWSLSEGSILHELTSPSRKQLHFAALALNDSIIASGSDKEIYVWRLSDLHLVHTLFTSMEEVRDGLGGDFYPRLAVNDLHLIAGFANRSALIWQLSSGELLHQFGDCTGLNYDFGCAIMGNLVGLYEGKAARICDLSVHGTYRKADSERRGVCAQYIVSVFPREVRRATGLEDPNFHEIAPKFAYGPDALGGTQVCPRDGRTGCSIVDALPADCRGPATHFLSWAWGYKLSTFVDTIQAWVADSKCEPSQVFLWVCFFCNNQVRILQEQSQEGSDNLEQTFSSRLTSIGRMLVLFDSWKDPFYLRRTWCVFETYMANQSGVDFEIVLAQNEKDSLVSEFERGNLTKVKQAMQKVDIERAAASRALDEERVKTLIKTSSSFEHVNTVVRDRLAAWFQKQFEVFMKKEARRSHVQEPPEETEAECVCCQNLRSRLEEKDKELKSKDNELELQRVEIALRDEQIQKLQQVLSELSSPKGAMPSASQESAIISHVDDGKPPQGDLDSESD